MEDEPSPFVEDVPGVRPIPECAGMDRIEEVVAQDHNGSKEAASRHGQPLQPGQGDHADADDPDNLEDRLSEAERPAVADHGDFEKDEPQSAKNQRTSELAALLRWRCR